MVHLAERSGQSTQRRSPAATPQVDPTYCMIFVTRRCNLDCAYCHMDHHTIPDPDTALLERGIALFMRSLPKVTLHLFGGEPLLRFDLVQWIVAHVAERYPDREVEFLITTNGLLLKPHILDYLMEHNIRLMLSLDGTYESQGEWRQSVGGDNHRAYEAVTERIRTLCARGIPHFVNMCVGPENVEDMERNVLHAKALGVRTLQVAYELGGMWDKASRRRFLAAIQQVIERHQQDGVFDIMNAPDAEPVLGNMTFIMDANGNLYRGCAIVLEKHMPTFDLSTRIGHVDDHETLAPFVRSKLAQVTGFLRYTRRDPHDWAILRSNYHLGYQLKRLLTKMGHRSFKRNPSRHAAGGPS